MLDRFTNISAKYPRAIPFIHLKTRIAFLRYICFLIGNHLSLILLI